MAPGSSFPLSWFPLWDSVQPRSFAPGCSAPCPSLGFTLAPSRHSLLTFLSPFEVSGFLCPARPCGLPFPLRSFDCLEVSLHLWSCSPSVLPEWRSLSGVSSFYLSLDSGSIPVTAYFCSPKGLWTVTSSAPASIKTDARLYALLRFEV